MRMGRRTGSPTPAGSANYSALPNRAQVNALLEFQSRVLDFHGALANWTVPRVIRNGTFFCSWPGVTCSSSSSNAAYPDIVGLVRGSTETSFTTPLMGKDLHPNSIPPQFGDLTALTMLDLSYNGAYVTSNAGLKGLTGSIPAALSRCAQLQYLYLHYNSLSGDIPEALSVLTSLQEIKISNNNFNGSELPPVLTALPSLTALTLNYLGFSGPIPPSISRLSRLSYLYIQAMAVSGSLPSELGSMPSLEYLSIRSLPKLVGGLPDSLSRLSKLSFLQVKLCNLTWALPPARWWAGLRRLSYVALDGAGVSGSLPQALPSTLTELILNDNRITGNVPEPLIRDSLCKPGRGVSFGLLNLADNQLSGAFPTVLGSCTSLTRIDLGGNQLQGPIPRSFFRDAVAPGLVSFNVSGNRLWGQLPEDLMSGWPSLGTFDVSFNQFNGSAPTVHCSASLSTVRMAGNRFRGDAGLVLGSLSACSYLTLDVSDNRLSGSLPKNLAWSSLSEFYFQGNRIDGPLPAPVTCPELVLVSGSGNRLSGLIPPALLRACTSLKRLLLADNQLSGPLPKPAASKRLELFALDLGGNRLSGTLLQNLGLLAQLTTLNLSHNALSGPVPSSVSSLFFVTSLDLASNALNGTLPASLGKLRELRRLSLGLNQLSGPIPKQLAPPFLSKLTLLDLAGNRLNDTIPYGFAFITPSLHLNLSSNNLSGAVPGNYSGPLGSPSVSIANNSQLCGGGSYPACPEPAPAPAPPASIPGWAIAAIAVGSALVLALLGLIVGLLVFRLSGDKWSRGVLIKFREMGFTIHDLVRATDNFSSEHCVGSGGFGSVYKATLPDGTAVAVKRLADMAQQGDREFRTEVAILGRVSHRNLVRLLAAFVGAPPSKERLLIYAFISGGSLDQLITQAIPENDAMRSFEVRHKVVLDAARGLEYLHHKCDPGILHRDMKPSNVLLDEDLVAYVSDFGLAKEADIHKSLTARSGVAGTAGYLAPEYTWQGRLSAKTDVYAFGVTMIQIMSGRDTTDEEIAEQGVNRWAATNRGVLDRNLDLVSDEQRALALGCIKIGLLCMSRVAVDRPTMEEVVNLLENLEAFVTNA